MGTKIAWTNETWNPVVGCSKVSEGCTNCYAERMAIRLAYMGNVKYQRVVESEEEELWGENIVNTPKVWFDGWRGNTYCDESALDKPLHWRNPRRIFVVSMGDLFHPSVPFEFIDKVMTVIALCPQHTLQVLTKRAERMLEYSKYIFNAWPKNIIGMVTAENQAMADLRIPLLLQCGFKTTGVSIEPMLGEIDLRKYMLPKNCHIIGEPPNLDWVIIGGESGPKRRLGDFKNEQEWWATARDLANQGKAANVSIFIKQGPMPKVRVLKNIVSEIPVGVRPFVQYGKIYKAIMNKHGAISAITKDGLLGLKPDEFQRVGFWVSHKPEEWPEDLRLRQFPKGK